MRHAAVLLLMVVVTTAIQRSSGPYFQRTEVVLGDVQRSLACEVGVYL